jgi:A/G-specific adenine glycosylase
MAQQTQVARVIPKWFAFLDRWPTPEACAAAPLSEVLVLWEGLGYPRRARNLHLAANALTGLGTFPTTLAGLLGLPGVGPYTARAILAFAFEQDVAVVDTNTARVIARWHGETLDRSTVQQRADELVPRGEGWAWNQSLLDFGATVCTLRSPSCEICPVQDTCTYHGAGDDPAIGTAGVSVPQARFGGSDRQLRGKILRLVARDRLSIDQLVASMLRDEINLDAARIERLVAALMAEGLVSTSHHASHHTSHQASNATSHPDPDDQEVLVLGGPSPAAIGNDFPNG